MSLTTYRMQGLSNISEKGVSRLQVLVELLRRQVDLKKRDCIRLSKGANENFNWIVIYLNNFDGRSEAWRHSEVEHPVESSSNKNDTVCLTKRHRTCRSNASRWAEMIFMSMRAFVLAEVEVFDPHLRWHNFDRLCMDGTTLPHVVRYATSK